ncbi:unnamed protein product, partial [Nesidiocoris tenuis]
MFIPEFLLDVQRSNSANSASRIKSKIVQSVYPINISYVGHITLLLELSKALGMFRNPTGRTTFLFVSFEGFWVRVGSGLGLGTPKIQRTPNKPDQTAQSCLRPCMSCLGQTGVLRRSRRLSGSVSTEFVDFVPQRDVRQAKKLGSTQASWGMTKRRFTQELVQRHWPWRGHPESGIQAIKWPMLVTHKLSDSRRFRYPYNIFVGAQKHSNTTNASSSARRLQRWRLDESEVRGNTRTSNVCHGPPVTRVICVARSNGLYRRSRDKPKRIQCPAVRSPTERQIGREKDFPTG